MTAPIKMPIFSRFLDANLKAVDMRIQNPALVHFAGRVCGMTFKALFATLTKEIRTPDCVCPYDAPTDPHWPRYIYSAWHDSAILAAFGGSHRRTVALTSKHRDGEFVASVLRSVGVDTIRGSSRNGGKSAARQLLQAAKKHDVIITPDGPRGPRRQLSKGIIFLASRSGNAFVPTAYACSNAWEIQGSWTTQMLPKPFSQVVLMASDPIHVPPSLDQDGIEEYRLIAQRAMDTIQNTADNFFRNESVVRHTTTPALNRH